MTDPIARLNAALEGRYRLERQFGEWGMATVYLADDPDRWNRADRGRASCRVRFRWSGDDLDRAGSPRPRPENALCVEGEAHTSSI